MKTTILLFAVLIFLTFKNQAQTVTDIDGNVYHTIAIGTQVWMVENLKTTKYNDGNSIPLVTDSTVWRNLTTPAFCWYNNDTSYKNTYGALYNWFTVNTGKLIPIGWHVPTQDEWIMLETYLGGDSVAGGKMKSTGTIEAGTGLWHTPNTGATNESGFSGFPGGFRGYNGTFLLMGYFGYWLSATELDTDNTWNRLLNYFDTICINGWGSKIYGYSVRCVSDYPTSINNIKDMNKLKIYPNPVIDNIFIDYAEKKETNISIYNLLGELVLQKELKSSTNKIDISSLPKGIYILQITGADWNEQRKLTKE